jgi:quercetin dioxygenase-like cupin family protein
VVGPRSAGFHENASPPTLRAKNPFVEPDPVPQHPCIEITDLFRVATHPDEIPWQPFQDGVEIHRLYGDGITGPTAALIRFRKDGKVPAHAHNGYEHIIVLAGTQRDQNSTAAAGTLIINPPGTQHSVVSEAGCIVLAIYEKPVSFLAPGPARL